MFSTDADQSSNAASTVGEFWSANAEEIAEARIRRQIGQRRAAVPGPVLASDRAEIVARLFFT